MGSDTRETSRITEPGRLATGNVDTASYAVSGRKLFAQVCAMCHGPGGVGRPRLGKPLVNSEFIKRLDDDGLLAFVKAGRNPGDPKNTTGIPMPPRGGNPALSDDDLLDIISYLRTLQADASAAGTGH